MKTNKIIGLPPQINYYPNFLERKESKDLSNNLLKNLDWQRHQINMFGKVIPAPREFAWMGTPPAKGLYGARVTPLPWHRSILKIKVQLFKKLNVVFDSCNINLYRHEKDYLGWHIDPEDEGRWDCPIASISLGAVRPFEMRHYSRGSKGKKKHNRSDIYSWLLEPGSLITMPPGCQSQYLHRLPKLPAGQSCGPRINLTFRRIAEDEDDSQIR